MKGEWKNLYRYLLDKTSGKVLLILAAFFLFFIAFADFLANERPIYCQIEGSSYFPVLHEYLENANLRQPYSFAAQRSWTELNFDRAIYAPVRYSPNTIYSGQKPFQRPMVRSVSDKGVHFLGTDQVGRDVAAGIIHGTRTALFIGIGAMLLASFLGIGIGAVSGYYGDDGMKVSLLSLIFLITGGFLAGFYLLYGRLWVAMICVLLMYTLWWGFQHLFKSKLNQQVKLPADIIAMRAIEIFKSIPALFLLLAILALIRRPAIYHIIFIIGLFKWPAIARLVRAEMLHIRNSEYILAHKALGQSNTEIIWKHAIPNAIGPAVVVIAFGISSAVILEATISFLGLGLGAEDVTWGGLLSAARRNFSAWWLAVFPGMCIFLLVYLFNSLGDHYNEMRNR